LNRLLLFKTSISLNCLGNDQFPTLSVHFLLFPSISPFTAPFLTISTTNNSLSYLLLYKFSYIPLFLVQQRPGCDPAAVPNPTPISSSRSPARSHSTPSTRVHIAELCGPEAIAPLWSPGAKTPHPAAWGPPRLTAPHLCADRLPLDVVAAGGTTCRRRRCC
jgi:hypothetical protein